MLFAGWEVRMVKNCDQELENAARSCRPRAAFSSRRSQFFTIRTDFSWQIACLFKFFSCSKLVLQITNGLFTQLLSFNGLAHRLPKKNSWQRTGNSDSRQKKDLLKNILFSNYFMLALFISLIKFSKIVFAV